MQTRLTVLCITGDFYWQLMDEQVRRCRFSPADMSNGSKLAAPPPEAEVWERYYMRSELALQAAYLAHAVLERDGTLNLLERWQALPAQHRQIIVRGAFGSAELTIEQLGCRAFCTDLSYDYLIDGIGLLDLFGTLSRAPITFKTRRLPRAGVGQVRVDARS
ncbi:hypothetical protein JCM8547_000216 [Rhodosporidiobolus lusitaniae]